MSDSLGYEFGNQRLHGAVALLRVAGSAEKLEVIEVVAAALRLWHDVIHGKVAEREVNPAAVADAFLPPVERVTVRPVVREHTQVRPAYVGSGDDWAEHAMMVGQPFADQLDGER